MKRIVGPACLALAGLLAFGAPAANAEEGVAMKNLLGNIGLIPKDKEPIHYRERAPLVLPPKMDLREPQAAGLQASRNPAWPKDPEVAARDRRDAEERRPVTSSDVRRMSERNPGLSVEELRTGRGPTASASASVPGTHRGDNARDVLYANPDGTKGDTTPDDGTPATRRTLADPPTPYRKTAGGGPVKSDFKVKVDQQEIDASPMAWLTRKFRGGEDDE